MKLVLSILTAALTPMFCAQAGDPFTSAPGPFGNERLPEAQKLNASLIENVFLMPEQITKLIFPKPVEEVSVNTKVVTIQKNPPESKENYLLISPLVSRADVNMHVVLDGVTYTFRLYVGLNNAVNYRKTYSLEGSENARNMKRVKALAPGEINTTQLIRMITQAQRDPNYLQIVAKDLGWSQQNRNYMWNNAQVSLIDAWHYYPQDVVVLRVEVYNPSSKALYLSASQLEAFIANTPVPYLLNQQGTKVLLPGQTDVKYLFIQGHAINIEGALFELKLPPSSRQIKPE